MSKYVHDLVKNMTRREKGYFKMASSVKGNYQKNYLQLYEYVESTPIYDIEEAKTTFKHSSIGKYLSSEYNYLAEQLMKSLINFHFDKSDKNKIWKSTLFIDILIKKDLETKALKILRHIKKLAYQNEFFAQVLTLIDQEEEILFKQGIIDFTENLKNIELERKNIIDKINNLNQLRLLREQIRELWFQEGYLDQKTKKHPILDNPILENENKVLSFRAKEHWHYAVSMKAYILQNYSEAVSKFMNGINFVESKDNLFEKSKLLVFISNYLYNCALVKDLPSFQIGLNKLEALESSLDIKYIVYCRSLELYYQLNDHKKSILLETEVYPFIVNHSRQLEPNPSNYIYFLLTRNNIIRRDFEKALDNINQWLQLKVIEYYYLHIKLFLLITYLELGFFSLLSSEIESSYKTLKSHKQYNNTAIKMISFFKKIIRTPEKEMFFLKKLQIELSEVKMNDKNEKNYKHFNYLIWVENRVNHLFNKL